MEETRSRNSIQRNIVMDAVQHLPHPTADEVFDSIHATYPTISKGTVYRNLNLLAEKRNILHIPNPYGADHYDHTSYDHYHFTCRECGRVSDVDLPYIAEIDSMIKDKHGYTFEHHDIVFTGICPDCKNPRGDAPEE